MRAVTLRCYGPAGVSPPRQDMAQTAAWTGLDKGWAVVRSGVGGNVVIQAGPAELTAANLAGCVTDFFRAWELAVRAPPQSPLVAERTEFRLSGERIDAETMRVLAELTAPALLLLLAPRQDDRVVASLDRGTLCVASSGLPAEHLTRCALPILFGAFMSILADIRRRRLPSGLVRFPHLVTVRQPGPLADTARAELCPPEVLGRGRMTLLTARSRGRGITVYAQEALSVLYLYAETEVRRLAGERAEPAIRRMVFGRAPLPAEMTGPGHVPRPVVTLSRPAAARSRPAAAPASSPAVVALVQAGPLRMVTKWVAQAVMTRPDVSVLICPWWLLRFTSDGVVADGAVWAGDNRSGVLRRADVRSVPIDVLYFDGARGGGKPRTEPELAALRRLAPLGIVHGGMVRRLIASRLLLEASRRGVVTNANACYQSWDAKHGLEFALREYERMSGQVIARPVTYSARATQLPIVLRALIRNGRYAIVKPVDGMLGRGLHTVPPSRHGRRGFPPGRYVVQELVKDPLLAAGRKVDLRCHLLIDPEQRAASGWTPPILVRVAGVPYERGNQDAENVNLTYQRKRGLRPVIVPLPEATMLSANLRQALQDGVEALGEQLIDAYFTVESRAAGDRDIGRRVFLWGFDVAVSAPRGRLRFYLLENNTRPQLYRNQSSCDEAMAIMISRHHLTALLRRHHSPGSAPRDVACLP